MKWDVGVRRCKPLYIEWINNKALLYSKGTLPGINHNGEEYKNQCIYVSN